MSSHSCLSPSSSSVSLSSTSSAPSGSSIVFSSSHHCHDNSLDLTVDHSHFHPGVVHHFPSSCSTSNGQLQLYEKVRFLWQSEGKESTANGSSASSCHRGSKPCALSIPFVGLIVNMKFLGKGSIANKAKDQAEQTNQLRMMEFQRQQQGNSSNVPVLVKLPPAYVADKYLIVTSVNPSQAVVRLVFSLDSHHQRQSIWVREDFVNAGHPQPLMQLAVDTPFIVECWFNQTAKEAFKRVGSSECLRFHDLLYENNLSENERKMRRKRKSSDKMTLHLQIQKLELNSSLTLPSIQTQNVVAPSPRVFVKKARKTPDSTLCAPLRIPESITEEEIQNLIDSQEGKIKLSAELESKLSQAFHPSLVSALLDGKSELGSLFQASNIQDTNEFKFSSEAGDFVASESLNNPSELSNVPDFSLPMESGIDFQTYSDEIASIPSSAQVVSECSLNSLCVCSVCSSSLHHSASESISVSASYSNEGSEERAISEHSHFYSHPEFSFSQSDRGEFDHVEETSLNSYNGIEVDDDRDFDSTNSNSSTYSLTFHHFSKFNLQVSPGEENIDSEMDRVMNSGDALEIPTLSTMKSEEWIQFDSLAPPAELSTSGPGLLSVPFSLPTP
jgi:hypothetical protein